MNRDSDYITVDESLVSDSGMDMAMAAVCTIPYKFLIILFVAFMVVSSDMFIARILSQFDGAVQMRYPTNWGTIIQGLFLVLAMLLVDGLIRHNIL
jgi:hypothetical protein